MACAISRSANHGRQRGAAVPFRQAKIPIFAQWAETNQNVGSCFDIVEAPRAFQADDEGSIPFTRSNVFNDLCHRRRPILTSGLLLILTNVRRSFA